MAAGTAATLQPVRGKERILLVEDEEAQRKSLAHGLERLGYQVTARADGRSAVTFFKKDPAAFDVVITDQIMPRNDGPGAGLGAHEGPSGHSDYPVHRLQREGQRRDRRGNAESRIS